MRALQNYATSAEDFESLQSHIVQAAKDLYGTAVSNEFAKAFEAHGYKPLQKVNQVIEVYYLKRRLPLIGNLLLYPTLSSAIVIASILFRIKLR